MKIKVIVVPLFGIPGGGKGSVIANLKKMAEQSRDISIIAVEMGAFFRERSKTDATIKDIMDSGGLISNSMVNSIFEDLLNASVASPLLKAVELKEKMIVLIDGYPRTLPQWEYFLDYRCKKVISVAAVFIDLAEEIVMHRSNIRRICPKCGGTFSAEEHFLCPHCKGSEGIRRADDLKMERRVKVFKEETSPVIQEAKNIFDHQITVSGKDTMLASEEVWKFLQML